MHIMRSTLLFLAGAIVGVLLGIPAFVLFLRTDAGASVVRSYVVNVPKWPDIAAQGVTQADIDRLSSASSTEVQVPAVYATQEYHAALNASLQDIASIGSSYTRLVSLLGEINEKSLKGDFSGFFDLVVEAKTELLAQRQSNTDLLRDISDLASANQNTKDAVTKSQTAQLVTAGTALSTAVRANIEAIDAVLEGSVPTTAQIDAMNSTALEAKTALEAFFTALQPIKERFKLKLESVK